VATAPAELSADDKKDKDKVKAFDDAKKAFDDYTAQSKMEPLAVKLARQCRHNRVAINFMWTLVTGFLVMSCRRASRRRNGVMSGEDSSHTMAMNFMIYRWACSGFISAVLPSCSAAWAIGTMGGYAGLNDEFTVTLFGNRSPAWHERLPAARRGV